MEKFCLSCKRYVLVFNLTDLQVLGHYEVFFLVTQLEDRFLHLYYSLGHSFICYWKIRTSPLYVPNKSLRLATSTRNLLNWLNYFLRNQGNESDERKKNKTTFNISRYRCIIFHCLSGRLVLGWNYMID
jgi:hypothetical protein